MTIYIKKLSTNECVFTLNESINSGGLYIIMELKYKEDRSVKLLRLNDDFSTKYWRYNQYFIEEVAKIDEDLEDQKIYLEIGSYDFYVWGTESTEFNLDGDKVLLESGILRVEN